MSIYDHPFSSEYGDHFETSPTALNHLMPALEAVCTIVGKTKDDLQIYDPFYCSGTIEKHFEKMGFPLVWNANRDFWKDVANRDIPKFDILVSSPPFSLDHKENTLEFCVQSKKAWALLMPTYVASKMYFRESVLALQRENKLTCLFIVPYVPYEFSHPEGTGHETSPFTSMWYFGIPSNLGRNVQATIDQLLRQHRHVYDEHSTKYEFFVTDNVNELKANRIIPSEKRPSPKQRKRRAKQMRMAMADH